MGHDTEAIKLVRFCSKSQLQPSIAFRRKSAPDVPTALMVHREPCQKVGRLHLLP